MFNTDHGELEGVEPKTMEDKRVADDLALADALLANVEQRLLKVNRDWQSAGALLTSEANPDSALASSALAEDTPKMQFDNEGRVSCSVLSISLERKKKFFFLSLSSAL